MNNVKNKDNNVSLNPLSVEEALKGAMEVKIDKKKLKKKPKKKAKPS